jgi:prophage regulatory protein
VVKTSHRKTREQSSKAGHLDSETQEKMMPNSARDYVFAFPRAHFSFFHLLNLILQGYVDCPINDQLDLPKDFWQTLAGRTYMETKQLSVRDRFMRLPAVIEVCGIGKTTIYHQIREGTFPAPITLGAKSVAWLASEIDAWMAAKITASRLQK